MQTVTSKDGTKIAYDQTGKGQAVILVDGALCYRGFGSMPQLAALLAPHFSVITYDRRGRGDSGNTLPYAIEREVDDIEALIKQAGGSASLYGISSGAALALEAAVCGLNVRKLAMYEPPFMVDTGGGPRPPENAAQHVRQLAATGKRGDAVEYFMMMTGATPEQAAGARGIPEWPTFEAVAHTLEYDLSIMEDNQWFLNKRAASVTVPTLIMDGGNSPAWAGNAAQAIVSTLPNARRRTIPGQDHEASVEALAPALIEFFSD